MSESHWEAYHKLQYERIAQHENQRMQFSGMVAGGSVAVFAFLASGTHHILGTAVVCAAVVLINIAAAFFVDKSRAWVRFHQKRARRILEHHNKDLLDLIDSDCENRKPDSDRDRDRRTELQKRLHFALVAMAAALPVVLGMS